MRLMKSYLKLNKPVSFQYEPRDQSFGKTPTVFAWFEKHMQTKIETNFTLKILRKNETEIDL